MSSQKKINVKDLICLSEAMILKNPNGTESIGFLTFESHCPAPDELFFEFTAQVGNQFDHAKFNGSCFAKVVFGENCWMTLIDIEGKPRNVKFLSAVKFQSKKDMSTKQSIYLKIGGIVNNRAAAQTLFQTISDICEDWGTVVYGDNTLISGDFEVFEEWLHYDEHGIGVVVDPYTNINWMCATLEEQGYSYWLAIPREPGLYEAVYWCANGRVKQKGSMVQHALGVLIFDEKHKMTPDIGALKYPDHLIG